MKKILTTLASAILILSAAAAAADTHESEGPTFRPVEGWTCNYKDGKGPADLDGVIDDWNDWMDDQGITNHFAVMMTPQYFGEWNFDFAWIGVWSDGKAMGAGTDVWMNKGSEMGAAFGEIINCSSHSNFASQNIKRGEQNDDESDDSFVVTFANCSINDGKSFDDFMAAQEAWNAYADEHGFTGSSWVWWPVWGETDDSYDFKVVGAVDDHTALGANWQLYSEGHYNKSSELFEGIVDCDIGRVYDARVLREMAEEDD